MAMGDLITIGLTGHGTFTVTADGLDCAMSRYLPGSPYSLRQKIDAHEENDRPAGTYDNLITVSECLMVLAWLDAKKS